ncbi:unnamed protein product [Lactuca virosa]|uniref:Uncharacterized protein n=1 Tax=Lactuca virosa TaxID=75947 RepID=A0AAU9NFH8_9ASTR|nr:unnamed protein product [Lactuca virosa]
MAIMAFDMSTVVFEVDSFMLDRYVHEYHLSPIFGIELPSLSSSILDALFGKVGYILGTCSRHFPLSPDLSGSNGGWKSKFCWVDIHSFRLPFITSPVPPVDASVSLSNDLSTYIAFFAFMCTKVFFARIDGSKCPFQLNKYLYGDIHPQSLMLEAVTPDKDMDSDAIVLGSPLRLHGFGSDTFFSLEELNEACLTIARAENIISTVLGLELKFFDGSLSLRVCYLFVEVSLRAAESMNLTGEEMLFKARKMYAELDGRYRDVVGRVTILENQMRLLESNYEACLQENYVLRAKLTSKSP